MLTDNAIRSAKPSEKPYKMGDSGGLFILIHPSGERLRSSDQLNVVADSRPPAMMISVLDLIGSAPIP